MTDEATTYWLQVHHLVPWLAATRYEKKFVDSFRRGGSTAQETAEIITQRRLYYRKLQSKSADQ